MRNSSRSNGIPAATNCAPANSRPRGDSSSRRARSDEPARSNHQQAAPLRHFDARLHAGAEDGEIGLRAAAESATRVDQPEVVSDVEAAARAGTVEPAA